MEARRGRVVTSVQHGGSALDPPRAVMTPVPGRTAARTMPATSAGPPRRRAGATLGRLALTLVVVGAFVVVPRTPASATTVASPYSFIDTQSNSPRADILRVTVRHGTTVKVKVWVGRAVPFERWASCCSTPGVTSLEVWIDGTSLGDGSHVRMVNEAEGAVVGRIIDDPECPVARTADTTRNFYLFSFARSCLHNPPAFRVMVELVRRVSTNPNDKEVDTAPQTANPRDVYTPMVAYAL